jgi:glycosyltransferase involved in cell wall biosynthesis
MDKPNAKYKVVDHCWHLAHSYELLKNPALDWHYVMNTYRKWEWTIRGTDFPGKWVPYYEPGKYDVAILHLDQSCVDPRIGKSRLFREMKAALDDIPKIIIMHGTPMYDGYSEDLVINGGEVKRPNSDQFEYWEGIKDLVGDIPMVVNSHRAKERWGWGDVIWHGMDPEEWYYGLPKEPRIITSISPAGMSDEYYGRRFLETVRAILAEEYGIKHQWLLIDYTPEMDVKRYHKDAFESLRNFFGRSLIYFDPTGDSPMPRARTEAMLSGCCLVTAANHDVERYITPGENGFIVPRDARVTAKLLADLIYSHPQEAKAIGQRGRETAKELFHIDRFNQDWVNLIDKVIAGYSGKDQERLAPKEA